MKKAPDAEPTQCTHTGQAIKAKSTALCLESSPQLNLTSLENTPHGTQCLKVISRLAPQHQVQRGLYRVWSKSQACWIAEI